MGAFDEFSYLPVSFLPVGFRVAGGAEWDCFCTAEGFRDDVVVVGRLLPAFKTGFVLILLQFHFRNSPALCIFWISIGSLLIER